MLRGLRNARVVTPEAVLDPGSVLLDGDRIAAVLPGDRRVPGEQLDARGRWLLPGLVDLHCDAIEQHVRPRPGIELPGALAFLELDRRLISAGVTTTLHAVAIMEGKGRHPDRGREVYELIARHRAEAGTRHELHVRCELPQPGSVRAVEELLGDGLARVASVMDHTPGQGQFRNLEWYRRYYVEHRGADPGELAGPPSATEEREPEMLGGIRRIARAAARSGAILASHDDDTPARVDLLAGEGVRISEFPVDLGAARRAAELALTVCMGAPNVIRGRSSGGNLSATAAIDAGVVDCLCSDYSPPSLLRAAFTLAERGRLSLPAAVALVTERPARAVALMDRGSIREGALADLVVVGRCMGEPAPTHVVVGGRAVGALGEADGSA